MAAVVQQVPSFLRNGSHFHPNSTNVTQLEDLIRTKCQTNRIQVKQYFHDYDKLRSGYVTKTQFFRTLHQNLGIKMTPEEERDFAEKYDTHRNGRLNYQDFCGNIDKCFNANDLKNDPATQKVEPREFLGTERSVLPLPRADEAQIEKLLLKMQAHYDYHGIILCTSYQDFDKHHIGVVTESQFYRNFPGPPDVTETEMQLLVDKYRDPDRPGLLNYLNLNHDLVALAERQNRKPLQMPQATNISAYLPSTPLADKPLQAILDKIRIAVFKCRVRTTEFFRDHDKLRSGLITENQFVCGLSAAAGKEAHLNRHEIQKVCEFYKNPDGRVRYKEFCDYMENAFNVPNLEKNPTTEVVRPPRGALGRTLNQLPEDDEKRVLKVLAELTDQVKKRRPMMYEYFKDFDRGKGHSRKVTQSQFERVLHFLSLSVGPEDFKLLCKMFAEPVSGDVNYPAFVQAIDPNFVGFVVDSSDNRAKTAAVSGSRTKPMDMSSSQRAQTAGNERVLLETVGDNVTIDELMARIRHHVLVNRLRVSEFFEDFDQLRSGLISITRFRRGLSLLGLDKLGHHDLTRKQFDLLCKHYNCPSKPDQVYWNKFLVDVESVFTQPNLEKNPCHVVPAQEIFRVPKPGTVDWRNASADHKDLFDQTMHRLKQRAAERRVLAKPVFQDFDKHNNGYVTRQQFCQCLTMLELHTNAAEMAALEAKFCNDTGFNYLRFLNELEPKEPPKLMYVERLKDIRSANMKGKLPEHSPATDVEGVLCKIKTKVFKERVRVLEFMKDFDKLNSGRVLKTSFRRALDLCRFELTESECALLEDRFESPNHMDYVDYRAFSDEIESIFTMKDLEKSPLSQPVQFKPPVEWEQNSLPQGADEMFQKCMERLAEKVGKQRMQLFPLFEDYDRVHNGTVSRSQFHRVLSELELGGLVSQQEFGLLYQKFDQKVGGKDDVNYIAFCQLIYEYAEKMKAHSLTK
ncbi:uncharacterized protein LOC141903328 [Tubulanus polymorphus]|uniref:uncharacterized protein LOC141903328 n=1 Tax=Tubulanus polymorphus TaxID=672921 RepID=UPI003DA5EFC5